MAKTTLTFPTGTDFSFKNGQLSVECDSMFIQGEDSEKRKWTNVDKQLGKMTELLARCPGIKRSEFAKIFDISIDTVYKHNKIRGLFKACNRMTLERARDIYGTKD